MAVFSCSTFKCIILPSTVFQYIKKLSLSFIMAPFKMTCLFLLALLIFFLFISGLLHLSRMNLEMEFFPVSI